MHKLVRAAKKQNLKSVIWVPDFGCPGWYIGLANGWHMSLTFFKGDRYLIPRHGSAMGYYVSTLCRPSCGINDFLGLLLFF